MNSDSTRAEGHCGFVALLGKPNVGKSSILNRILGQKISITSRRRQTTRHRIIGIKSEGGNQAIYVDTPGLHAFEGRAINRYMNRSARSAIHDVDVVVFVVSCRSWTAEDAFVARSLSGARAPIVVAVNKIDRLDDRSRLLPYLDKLRKQGTFEHIVPVSARSGENLDVLERHVQALLPTGLPIYPDEQLTDRSERFLAAEIVREKLTRRLGQELPYALSVEIERYSEEDGLTRVDAIIWIERRNQKGIVIGHGGKLLKSVGEQARHDLEHLIQQNVALKLWVKVRKGWTDDEAMLQRFGYQ